MSASGRKRKLTDIRGYFTKSTIDTMDQFPVDFQEIFDRMMAEPFPSMDGYLFPEEQIDTMDHFTADLEVMFDHMGTLEDVRGRSFPSMYGHLVPEEQIHTVGHFPVDLQEMLDHLVTLEDMRGQSFPSMYGHLVPEEQVQQRAGPAEQPVANHKLHNTTNTSCAICLMEYVVGEDIRLLMCDHVFHLLCIGTWLQENNTCPICRADV